MNLALSPPTLCPKYLIVILNGSLLSFRQILTLLLLSPILNIMNPHQYRPLSGPRCTRLIRLHPGTTKDPSCPLRCDLNEIDLDNPPDYFALSYTWNGETPSEPLTISNAQVNTSQSAGSQLLITPNCAAALKVFRKSLHRRIKRRKYLDIWVDAICINQGSSDDKGTQVARMSEIFRHAKRVVVWLASRDSPPSPRPLLCSLACVALPDLQVGSLSGFFNWTERSKAVKWLVPQVERLEKLAADAVFNLCCDRSTLLHILGHSYWTRVWTVQEFANTHVSFLCGNSNMISCAGIMKMLDHTSHTDAVDGPQLHKLSYTYERVFQQYSTAINIDSSLGLKYTLRLQATDPRDRIFAFRAFSKVFAKINVDYRRPLQDLSTETSVVFIKETDSLFLLYFASPDKTSPGTETGSMPSWSVDFGTKEDHSRNRGAHFHQLGRFANASRGSSPQMLFLEHTTSLRVRGRSAGVTGNFISNSYQNSNSHSMTLEDEYASANSGNQITETLKRFFTVVRQRLESNPGVAVYMAQALYELMKIVMKMWPLKQFEMPNLGSSAAFEDIVELFANNRDARSQIGWCMGEGRMFFTRDRQAGLGVPRITEGDEIFIIAGLNHPFVLRLQGGTGEYILVGPAVVTGMMNGELWPDDESELRDIDIV